ncbi:MAG: 3-oxoacyl-ACP reductase FabG [Ignavibacteriales bacterium]|nr:MAG: 3-oxoacyl-ACP reductase FabG [Ignavibacteriales bacterium]
MINLQNKIAFITGGSRGIGAACVELFAKAGANVAFTFKSNKKAADELITKINQPNKVVSYCMNMESESDIKQIVALIESDFGRIDILVNNAGIWKFGEADKMNLEDWNETIGTNLTGYFLVTKAVIPVMKENNFGRIIHIASTAGQRGEAFHSHYAASKGAAIAFSKSLAVELSKFNITSNCVAPGWVDTEMCESVFSDVDYKESVRKDIPVGRIASAEDIAGPVLFLASDLARHINGAVLSVNGGSVLCG